MIFDIEVAYVCSLKKTILIKCFIPSSGSDYKSGAACVMQLGLDSSSQDSDPRSGSS